MAAFGPTMSLGLTEYISVAAVTADIGSALTAAHFWKGPKVSMDLFPQNVRHEVSVKQFASVALRSH
ncbi:hypothetical protein PspCFBP13509_18825 [Pseudomonas sp. CFBP13509]|nr:hypothetical protein PspCFBP13509_18825 [Pseudomonas sp. CFBP13509]